jgi:hypothetical protein
VNGAGFADWLAVTSIWTIAFVLLLAMVAAAVAGYFIRKWRLRRRGPGDPEKENHEGFVLSAVLGLLALLLGFTFALAVDRFETRRALVLEEANAIGTAYLRTQLLEEPHRARISRLLVDYTENRIAMGKAPFVDARTRVARNDRLVTELWVATIAAFPSIRGIDFTTAYLDSMNLVIDLDESRKASRQAKVPYEVYFVLFVYIVCAAGVMGFTLDGPLERWAATFLFLLLTLSLMLIVDIDRPASGGINESQRPMEDLQASLRVWQAGAFDPPAPARSGDRR